MNHFDAGFHRDDFPNIVENRHVRNGELKTLITSPRAFSSDTELADFRPLLAVLFATEYGVRADGQPSVFQMSSFIWFLPLPFLVYLVARIVPDGRHQASLLTAALFAVHPIVSDTLNYVSRTGELIAAGAVAAALVIWAVWPDRLPRTLGFNLSRIPKTSREELIFKYGARIDKIYKFVLAAPAGFYFLPLFIGLLCSPAAAAFAGVAAAWAWVYPPKRGWSRLIPGAVVCALWLALHTVLSWRYLAPLRIPALQYWLGQPRVALQYFVWFFTPFNLSADAGLIPQVRIWPPDALAGILGIAALGYIATIARRHAEWRPVAFGIAWFLAAQLPFALIPQTTMDSGARMFIPAIGLAIAVGHALLRLADKAQELPRFSVPATIVCSTLLFGLIATSAWLTFQRNKIWLNDQTLWLDNVKRSPENQRALIQYAWVMIRENDFTSATPFLERAEKAPTQDAPSELLLAAGLDRMGLDTRAEGHFTRAISLWPRYSTALSSYGKWLFAHQRTTEAADWSQKALQLNNLDNDARHTLMDVHSAVYEWPEVRRLATDALRVDPDDAMGRAALATSQDALGRIGRAEHTQAGEVSSNDYLSLSVAYYRAKRFDDAIRASREALKLSPDLAEAYANIAAASHAVGRDDEAATALREVVRLRPDFTFARANLQLLEEQKRKSPAKK